MVSSAADVTVRPLALSDTAEVLRLLQDAEATEPTDEAYDADDVTEELTHPGVDLPALSVGLESGGGLVAAGWLTVRDTPTGWVAMLDGVVDPARRRWGLGTRLVRELTDRAAHRYAVTGNGRPGEVRVFVNRRRRWDGAPAERCGFHAQRYWFRMGRDLTTAVTVTDPPPADSAPGGSTGWECSPSTGGPGWPRPC